MLTNNQLGALLSLAAAFIAVGIGGLLVYEFIALWFRKQPITWIVRNTERAHPRWVVLGFALVALLIGHFLRF